MLRAAKLEVELYEEVEADKEAFKQALVVVFLSSLAAGIGSISKTGLIALISGTIGALLGWFLWSLLTYIIGTKLLPEPQTEADYGQLLRTIGFSSSPGVIRVLGVVPFLSFIVNGIAAIWMLIAMIVAVRQALDYNSTLRAIGVCFIGWIIQCALLFGLLFLVGRP
jgi:hypothetical protein